MKSVILNYNLTILTFKSYFMIIYARKLISFFNLGTHANIMEWKFLRRRGKILLKSLECL